MPFVFAEVPFPSIDPVIIQLPFGIALRWYGLMYVAGFIAGGWILDRLSRRGFLPLSRDGAQDLVIWLVFGVLLGGRIGYILVYKPSLLTSPLDAINIMQGGMSFHGGLAGVLIACFWFCRRRQVRFGRVADALALAVTPGIFAVRCANFINGELYGRVTDASVPWAMRFPTDPVAWRLLDLGGLGVRERELAIHEAISSGKWQEILSQVPLRHPSQLYEGLSEGLLLGLILWLVYRSTRKSPLAPWRYGGVFICGYGVLRFLIEFVRQPDAQFASKPGRIGTVLGPFSMGQVLCFLMVLAGAWMLFHRSRPGPATSG